MAANAGGGPGASSSGGGGGTAAGSGDLKLPVNSSKLYIYDASMETWPSAVGCHHFLLSVMS